MKNTLNNKNYIKIYQYLFAKSAKLNMTFIYKLIITFMWKVGGFFILFSFINSRNHCV